MIRGALKGLAPWTAEEDETVRRAYGEGGIRPAMAALPHRSRKAIFHRARHLGIQREPRWTEENDKRLRMLWDEEPIAEIAAKLGRSPAAVYYHARLLGLSFGRQRGWEYLSDAAKRTGYRQNQLRRILRRAGVSMRAIFSNPKTSRTGRHCHLVDPIDVDDAVAEWIQREPVATAARRIGIPAETLRRRLLSVGIEPARPVGRPKKRASTRWRVSDEDVAKAMEGWKPYNRGPIPITARRGSNGRWSRAQGEEALRHDRSRGSTAPSSTVGKVAEPRGSAAVDDPAHPVMPVRRFTPGRPAGRSATL